MLTFDNHRRIREAHEDGVEDCRICLTCSDGGISAFKDIEYASRVSKRFFFSVSKDDDAQTENDLFPFGTA